MATLPCVLSVGLPIDAITVGALTMSTIEPPACNTATETPLVVATSSR